MLRNNPLLLSNPTPHLSKWIEDPIFKNQNAGVRKKKKE